METIPKERLGGRIENLIQLVTARDCKWSVVVPGWRWSWPKPAAFVIQQPGEILYRMFASGMFVYLKPSPLVKPHRRFTRHEPTKDSRADSNKVANRPGIEPAGDHTRAAKSCKPCRRQAAASRKAARKTKKGKVG